MDRTKTKRIMALIGVILILLLFIMTVVFLLIGNAALAITCVAVNGFVSIVLYFTMRFHSMAVEDETKNEDLDA